MQVLKKKVCFPRFKTSPKSRAKEAAVNQNVAYAHRHVFLDNNNNKNISSTNWPRLNAWPAKRLCNCYRASEVANFCRLEGMAASTAGENLKLVHLSDIVTVLNPQLMKTAEN